jgi:hypothetical protein
LLGRKNSKSEQKAKRKRRKSEGRQAAQAALTCKLQKFFALLTGKPHKILGLKPSHKIIFSGEKLKYF